MNNEWLQIQANNGVCEIGTELEHDADMTEIRNDYRWTPQCQRAFLEALAFGGSVLRAAKHVGKSPRSAYGLRFRRDGAAFALGWDAAILVSRYALQDMLMDRAVNGYEEISTKQDDGTTLRGRFDNRLSKGMLDRLDRLADAQAVRGSRNAHIQCVVQDFESFLDLIENGGTGAQAALFCAARDDGPAADVTDAHKPAIGCELVRISASDKAAPDILDEEPAVAAYRLGVWFDEDACAWRTNYPRPDGRDAHLVTEIGFFGDVDYERTLTLTEEAAHLEALQRKRQPWIDAAITARDAWFGEKMAA
ncbi:hypothetical protein [Sphingorhabdus sp.]|jgi:hypothetical protein|uniref:hypothetical protein n=1 Tax=Sphingorhabdus sp. TaxID=1902408 RepID=UPI0037C5B122